MRSGASTVAAERAATHLFDQDGFAVIPDVFDAAKCDAFSSRLIKKDLDRVGLRGLLDLPWCEALGHRLIHHPLLNDYLPGELVPLQCTLFDKSIETNWHVVLHQDLSIPVAARVDSPECTGWSEKEGRLYVQPPVAVLERLVAVRLHLDECGMSNGPLRVVPGSHRFGRLTAETAVKTRAQNGETVVPVSSGGALMMRPLLLHASSKATEAGPRRVLHFVFGPALLPLGLNWAVRHS